MGRVGEGGREGMGWDGMGWSEGKLWAWMNLG